MLILPICFLMSLAALVFFFAYFHQSLLGMLMDNRKLLVWMRADLLILAR